MEQERGIMCKRANGRRKAGDDDDEEYIVGEEDVDESESSDESLVFSSDEEEMELGDEEEEEEEIEISRSNTRRKSSGGRKRITEASVLFDEDEENGVSARFRRRKGKVLTYEEEDEEEEDYEDEDFAPDEEEEEGKEVSLISRSKISGKKRKSRVSNKKKRRMSREQEKGRNIRRKRMNSTAVKKRRSLDSDTYNSQYMTHDDEFISKNPTVKDKGRAKSKKGRKRRTIGSESSDSEYVVSEEELRDLGVKRVLNQPQLTRFFTGRMGEEKGKGKEADDSGMQVCGICLSEEQIGTVQGVLDCCAHYFCFACIMAWSKVESRCPVCKRRFASITKSLRAEIGFRMKKTVVKVQKRDQVYQPSEEEIRGILDPYWNVVCMECQTSEEDYLMLLCDICDSPAHTYCVGLGREVPEGNWYCQCCRSAAEGSSQLQDRMTDQGIGSFEANNPTNIHAVTPFQRSVSYEGQSSLQEIDLNVCPRDHTEEDNGAASLLSRGGVSTLSGRRAIQRRIHIFLSNSSRPRQIFARDTVSCHGIQSDAIFPEVE
ncbi:uncharacterized protein [Typha angustifolia]|uniref:uncharacterized protein n=1 Tax=Typha angustifolia TaxID=59011 RepID=UPI003C2DE21E